MLKGIFGKTSNIKFYENDCEFFLLDSAINSSSWLNDVLRFVDGLSANIILSFVYFPTKDPKRKYFMGTFKTKPGVTIAATNMLKIKKT